MFQIQTCTQTRLYAFFDGVCHSFMSFMCCLTWPIPVCNMTHSYACRDSFICGTHIQAWALMEAEAGKTAEARALFQQVCMYMNIYSIIIYIYTNVYSYICICVCMYVCI